MIGVAVDQLVMPGYAAFHLATRARPSQREPTTRAAGGALPSVDEAPARGELEERPD